MADMGIPIMNVSDYCTLGLRVVLELADSGAFACGASRVWTGRSFFVFARAHVVPRYPETIQYLESA